MTHNWRKLTITSHNLQEGISFSLRSAFALWVVSSAPARASPPTCPCSPAGSPPGRGHPRCDLGQTRSRTWSSRMWPGTNKVKDVVIKDVTWDKQGQGRGHQGLWPGTNKVKDVVIQDVTWDKQGQGHGHQGCDLGQTRSRTCSSRMSPGTNKVKDMVIKDVTWGRQGQGLCHQGCDLGQTRSRTWSSWMWPGTNKVKDVVIKDVTWDKQG